MRIVRTAAKLAEDFEKSTVDSPYRFPSPENELLVCMPHAVSRRVIAKMILSAYFNLPSLNYGICQPGLSHNVPSSTRHCSRGAMPIFAAAETTSPRSCTTSGLGARPV